MSGPAQGIWSDVAVAPVTAQVVALGRRVGARVRGTGPSDDVHADLDRLIAAERCGAATPRAGDLLWTFGPSDGDRGEDPIASAFRVGATAVHGGGVESPVPASAAIAFAALGGARATPADVLVAIEVAGALAPALEAIIVRRGTVAQERAVLPAATLAAGVGVGVALGTAPGQDDVRGTGTLEAVVGLLASCVVGASPVPTTTDGLALAVACAARDVRSAIALVGEGFAVNARALEAPRGLLDALTGAPPAPGDDAPLGAELPPAQVPRGSAQVGRPSASASGTDDPLRALATFVAGARVPDGPRHAARRATANSIGLMVGACDVDAVRIARRTFVRLPDDGEARILGTSERAPAAVAAFVGGIAAHYEDFDDTHLRTVAHPGAVVPPAVVALAQRTDAPWSAVLDAVAVGIEAMLRVGDAISPAHLDRGWHVTATTGHLGAAAGCARLLGLDARATAEAMALALGVATGTQAVLGTMAKPFHPGRAARDGLEAAVLAAHGWTGAARALDGPDGFLTCGGDAPDLRALLDGCGDRWELLDNAFKPYACGIVAHPSIDAGIRLRDVVPDPDDLAAVVLTVNPFTLTAMGLATPQRGLEGKFSVHHATAVGYLVGRAGPDEFTDDVVRDPRVIAVRDRLRFVPDGSVARDAVEAVATSRDGGTHRVLVDHATGSVDRPMSDEQLHAKVVAEATRTLGAAAAVRLADRLLDRSDGAVSEVLRLAIT